MSKHRLIAAALLAATVAALVGVSTAASARHATTVSVMAVWTGAEQKSFEAVLAGFTKKNPGVKVKYTSGGDQMPTVLATAVQGGNPPDVAILAQPGLMTDFVKKGSLKPLTFLGPTMKANFAPVWAKLGQVNGKQYGLIWKGANKSTVWYNVASFKSAGVAAPKTWPQLLNAAKTLKASGTDAFSIGGADGWTLTDLFENLYLRTYGQAKYQALSAHTIKWTDPSVTATLKDMSQIFSDSGNLAGGSAGAIQNGFNDSVTNAFSDPPKGAMVFEGDFVAGVILSSTKAKPKTGFNAAPFPAVKSGPNANAVEIGGDLFVTFKDTPAIQAFVKFLASRGAAEAWAKQGGFGTGNKNVPASIYPDAITRATEAPIGQATSVVFDMSDEQPASFGSTTGQGEWGIFQDFLKNPSDVNGTASKLESAAAAAYKSGK